MYIISPEDYIRRITTKTNNKLFTYGTGFPEMFAACNIFHIQIQLYDNTYPPYPIFLITPESDVEIKKTVHGIITDYHITILKQSEKKMDDDKIYSYFKPKKTYTKFFTKKDEEILFKKIEAEEINIEIENKKTLKDKIYGLMASLKGAVKGTFHGLGKVLWMGVGGFFAALKSCVGVIVKSYMCAMASMTTWLKFFGMGDKSAKFVATMTLNFICYFGMVAANLAGTAEPTNRTAQFLSLTTNLFDATLTYATYNTDVSLFWDIVYTSGEWVNQKYTSFSQNDDEIKKTITDYMANYDVGWDETIKAMDEFKNKAVNKLWLIFSYNRYSSMFRKIVLTQIVKDYGEDIASFILNTFKNIVLPFFVGSRDDILGKSLGFISDHVLSNAIKLAEQVLTGKFIDESFGGSANMWTILAKSFKIFYTNFMLTVDRITDKFQSLKDNPYIKVFVSVFQMAHKAKQKIINLLVGYSSVAIDMTETHLTSVIDSNYAIDPEISKNQGVDVQSFEQMIWANRLTEVFGQIRNKDAINTLEGYKEELMRLDSNGILSANNGCRDLITNILSTKHLYLKVCAYRKKMLNFNADKLPVFLGSPENPILIELDMTNCNEFANDFLCAELYLKYNIESSVRLVPNVLRFSVGHKFKEQTLNNFAPQAKLYASKNDYKIEDLRKLLNNQPQFDTYINAINAVERFCDKKISEIKAYINTLKNDYFKQVEESKILLDNETRNKIENAFKIDFNDVTELNQNLYQKEIDEKSKAQSFACFQEVRSHYLKTADYIEDELKYSKAEKEFVNIEDESNEDVSTFNAYSDTDNSISELAAEVVKSSGFEELNIGTNESVFGTGVEASVGLGSYLWSVATASGSALFGYALVAGGVSLVGYHSIHYFVKGRYMKEVSANILKDASDLLYKSGGRAGRTTKEAVNLVEDLVKDSGSYIGKKIEDNLMPSNNAFAIPNSVSNKIAKMLAFLKTTYNKVKGIFDFETNRIRKTFENESNFRDLTAQYLQMEQMSTTITSDKKALENFSYIRDRFKDMLFNKIKTGGENLMQGFDNPHEMLDILKMDKEKGFEKYIEKFLDTYKVKLSKSQIQKMLKDGETYNNMAINLGKEDVEGLLKESENMIKEYEGVVERWTPIFTTAYCVYETIQKARRFSALVDKATQGAATKADWILFGLDTLGYGSLIAGALGYSGIFTGVGAMVLSSGINYLYGRPDDKQAMISKFLAKNAVISTKADSYIYSALAAIKKADDENEKHIAPTLLDILKQNEKKPIGEFVLDKSKKLNYFKLLADAIYLGATSWMVAWSWSALAVLNLGYLAYRYYTLGFMRVIKYEKYYLIQRPCKNSESSISAMYDLIIYEISHIHKLFSDKKKEEIKTTYGVTELPDFKDEKGNEIEWRSDTQNGLFFMVLIKIVLDSPTIDNKLKNCTYEKLTKEELQLFEQYTDNQFEVLDFSSKALLYKYLSVGVEILSHANFEKFKKYIIDVFSRMNIKNVDHLMKEIYTILFSPLCEETLAESEEDVIKKMFLAKCFNIIIVEIKQILHMRETEGTREGINVLYLNILRRKMITEVNFNFELTLYDNLLMTKNLSVNFMPVTAEDLALETRIFNISLGLNDEEISKNIEIDKKSNLDYINNSFKMLFEKDIKMNCINLFQILKINDNYYGFTILNEHNLCKLTIPSTRNLIIDLYITFAKFTPTSYYISSYTDDPQKKLDIDTVGKLFSLIYMKDSHKILQYLDLNFCFVIACHSMSKLAFGVDTTMAFNYHTLWRIFVYDILNYNNFDLNKTQGFQIGEDVKYTMKYYQMLTGASLKMPYYPTEDQSAIEAQFYYIKSPNLNISAQKADLIFRFDDLIDIQNCENTEKLVKQKGNVFCYIYKPKKAFLSNVEVDLSDMDATFEASNRQQSVMETDIRKVIEILNENLMYLNKIDTKIYKYCVKLHEIADERNIAVTKILNSEKLNGFFKLFKRFVYLVINPAIQEFYTVASFKMFYPDEISMISPLRKKQIEDNKFLDYLNFVIDYEENIQKKNYDSVTYMHQYLDIQRSNGYTFKTKVYDKMQHIYDTKRIKTTSYEKKKDLMLYSNYSSGYRQVTFAENNDFGIDVLSKRIGVRNYTINLALNYTEYQFTSNPDFYNFYHGKNNVSVSNIYWDVTRKINFTNEPISVISLSLRREDRPLGVMIFFTNNAGDIYQTIRASNRYSKNVYSITSYVNNIKYPQNPIEGYSANSLENQDYINVLKERFGQNIKITNESFAMDTNTSEFLTKTMLGANASIFKNQTVEQIVQFFNTNIHEETIGKALYYLDLRNVDKDLGNQDSRILDLKINIEYDLKEIQEPIIKTTNTCYVLTEYQRNIKFTSNGVV